MTAVRSIAAIDEDLKSVRDAKNHLILAPRSADRVMQSQALETRERELVVEREAAEEEAARNRLASLEAKLEETNLDDARAAVDAANHELVKAQAAVTRCYEACAAATFDFEQRARRSEGIRREIAEIHRAEAAKPEAIRAAYEAAMAVIRFVPGGSLLVPGSTLNLDAYAVDARDREAAEAINRYLMMATHEERGQVRDRLRVLAEKAASDHRSGEIARMHDHSREAETKAIASRSAAAERRGNVPKTRPPAEATPFGTISSTARAPRYDDAVSVAATRSASPASETDLEAILGEHGYEADDRT